MKIATTISETESTSLGQRRSSGSDMSVIRVSPPSSARKDKESSPTSTPPSSATRNRVNSFRNTDDPYQYDIVSALKDKRFSELNKDYQDKFNDLIKQNDRLSESVKLLQRQLNESNEARKIAENAATTNYILLKTEADKNAELTAANMQYIKDMTADKALVARLTEDREKHFLDSKQKEADLATSFSAEYQRLTYEFELMKSRYESKKHMLDKKNEELDKLLGQNFDLKRLASQFEQQQQTASTAARISEVPTTINNKSPRTIPLRPKISSHSELSDDSYTDEQYTSNTTINYYSDEK